MLELSRAPESTELVLTFTLPADEPAGVVSVVGNFND